MRDRRILDLFGIDIPILQAPMAGSSGPDMAIAVAEAGGLGALPCAMLTPDDVRREIEIVRQRTNRPFNLNFFTHAPPAPDPKREGAWRERLAPFARELGVDLSAALQGPARLPFDDNACALVEETQPPIVSFHFGLPAQSLLDRVRATGAKILSSATSVAEARWLEAQGCDAIIAQGAEAGGHRGMFLSDDVFTQTGLFSLLPQIADAVCVPVIAAGGVADARGIAAAFMLGASAVQIGTAYLFCPEAILGDIHRAALARAEDSTALTNVITGRPARGVTNRIMRELGPMNAEAPAFPRATLFLAALRAKAESMGKDDFTPLWAGQSAALGRSVSAGDLTRTLWAEAQALMKDYAFPPSRHVMR